VLEANPDYWDGEPAIERLVFKIYPDQRTAYQALLTGDLDIMTLSSSMWNEGRSADEGDHLEAHLFQSFTTWTLVLNQDGGNPFFTDDRARRALVLALDRPTFIETVLGGLALPGATTYHPATRWADPAVEPLGHAPEQAARLLDEAGWIDSDGDGLRDRDGRAFVFNLMIPSSNQKIVDHMAAWQQQSWAEIGARAEIDKLEWQTFRERRNAGNFDAASYTLRFTANPDQYELYHSSAREDGINYFGFADDEVDRLLEEGRGTFDVERRIEVYHALQRRLHELQPLTCLFYFATPVLHDRRLAGVVYSPLGFLSTSVGPRVWRWEAAADVD
jgi:peptide/nickel transport system substrate-binding protein